MNAVVVGYGIVGKATATAFGIKEYYDLNSQTVSLNSCANFRYIFICLPTPTIFGRCFTDDIGACISRISKKGKNNIFIIRSTVTPGTAKRIHEQTGAIIVSNPEFLSAATLKEDTINPLLAVVGSDHVDARDEVAGLYRGRYKYIEPIITDNTTAELIKYALNVFFATKVTFANELYDFVQDIGGNYETIRGVLEKHPWGSKNHFQVVYKGKRGIQGHCLPKDLEEFANATDSPFFKTMHTMNRRFIHD